MVRSIATSDLRVGLAVIDHGFRHRIKHQRATVPAGDIAEVHQRRGTMAFLDVGMRPAAIPNAGEEVVVVGRQAEGTLRLIDQLVAFAVELPDCRPPRRRSRALPADCVA